MLLLADGTVVDLAAPVGPPLGIGWLGSRRDGLATCRRAARCCCSPTGCSSGAGCRWTTAGRRCARSSPGSAGIPLDALCDRLLAEMLGDGVEDDVAVLAVRAHPVDVARPAEAGPELLPPAVPHPA